eukprot:scaffold11212_cov121-Cylindrotheca_fusiformis.AAC.6
MSTPEVINLCLSDNEDERSPAHNLNKKRKADSLLLVDKENECIVVQAPTQRLIAAAEAATGGAPTKDSDDDLELIGSTGPNALADFPHSREDCVTYPMAAKANNVLHCKNCFCFVCDVKAAECKSWKNHCHARKGGVGWEKKRRRVRELRQQENEVSHRISPKILILSFKVLNNVTLHISNKICTTVTLQMSIQEKEIFQKNLSYVDKSAVEKFQREGTPSSVWEGDESTKIGALLQEVKKLQERNNNFRAVVFTHCPHMHREVAKALRSIKVTVYEITGITAPSNRVLSIRAFQSNRQFAGCMVVTLQSGRDDRGILPIQAAHLYIMEPNFNLTMEMAAVNSIHHRDKKGAITVKRFVFADTMETNVVALHKEIESGRIQMQTTVSAAAVKILTKGLPF